MTARRYFVALGIWLAVLAGGFGLTLAVVAVLQSPKPLLRYDTTRLTAPLPAVRATSSLQVSPAGPVPAAAWVARTAAATGIPVPAVHAYAAATLRLGADQPSCRLGWTTLAGIGAVESQHGTIGGRTLDADGRPSSPIVGPALDGQGGVAAIPARGSAASLHGDQVWDHAVGPLQFLPATWSQWGADGDGDGVVDPQDIGDAAYAAGRYLCASGGDLSTGAAWASAVLSYNHSTDYVAAVYAAASRYAELTRS